MPNENQGSKWSPDHRARTFVTRDTDGVSLRRTLDELRSRMMLIGSASGLLCGAIAFLAVLLGWMWVDVVLHLPPLLRLLAWFTALAGLVMLGGMVIVRALRSSEDSRLARRLDDVAQTGGQIRSGLDLSGGTVRMAGQASELTRGLAELAVQQAGRLADGVPEDRVVPTRPLVRSGLGMVALIAGVLLLIALLPRMAQTELLRFANPYGDHPPYSRYEFSLTPDDLEVLYGESLDLTIDVDGPAVEQLELVMIPPTARRNVPTEEQSPIDVLPAFPSPDGSWHASIANVTTDFDLYLRVRRARSRTYPVRVVTVPNIQEVRAEVTPPLYTRMAAYEIPVGADGVSGLAGTDVRVIALSNRPLSGGTLTLQTDAGPSPVAMTPRADPHEVVAEFTMSQQRHFDVTIVDEAGQSSTESYSAPLTLLEDQHPIVRLQQPQSVSFATPSAHLPVVVAAEDDYGLSLCQLYRSLNDSRYLPTDLALPDGRPRRADLRTMLTLSEYGLSPGDEIKLFARVVDNDPLGDVEEVGKGSESAVATVRIISEEELQQMQRRTAGMEVLISKYQQAQRRLENIAETVEQMQETLQKLPPDSPVAEELNEQLQELAKQMQQEAEALRQLSKTDLQLDIDDQLSPQIQQMAEMLQKLSEQTSQSAGNPNLSQKELAEQLQQQLDAIREAQQQNRESAVQPLEHLQQVLPIKQAEAEFVQLVQRQRELAERLSSLRNFEGDDEPARKARIRELEEEQTRVRDQLTELLDRIEERAESLPDDERLDPLRESAREFVRAVRNSGAMEEMQNAESALAEFSGGRGHQSAERAADILEQFLSQCQGMGQQCKDCLPKFSPGFGSSLQQTLDQLVPGMSMNQGGMGLGMSGSGGYSSRSNTMQNVGIYGGLPLLTPGASQGGSSDSDNLFGVQPGVLATEEGGDGSQFRSSQSNPAFGGAEWGVPYQYRRQAGRYLQRLAHEFEE